MAVGRKAAFIDKDGTLIVDVPFNVDPARIRLMDGALAGVQRLARAGYEIVIVSNQSGVARGYFDEAALAPVEKRVRTILHDAGIKLSGFFYCPHHHEGAIKRYTRRCACRKPLPGLLTRAAAELDLDLAHSWMVGDILHDVEAGNRAGCGTVLLDNGNETEWKISSKRIPHFVAADLVEAASFIASIGPMVHEWEMMDARIRTEIRTMGGAA